MSDERYAENQFLYYLLHLQRENLIKSKCSASSDIHIFRHVVAAGGGCRDGRMLPSSRVIAVWEVLLRSKAHRGALLKSRPKETWKPHPLAISSGSERAGFRIEDKLPEEPECSDSSRS